MTSIAIANIGELVTWDDDRPVRHDAGLVLSDGEVAWVGDAADLPAADEAIDAGGRAVIPGFVDSHTHLVFAGDRAAEFTARMAGERYAAGGHPHHGRRHPGGRGGGAHPARRPPGWRSCAPRARRRSRSRAATASTPTPRSSCCGWPHGLTPETTYLGAHVVPDGWTAEAYVELVTGEMLDRCAPHARWIDVFCEVGAFDADAARTVLTAGMAAGLLPRIHANQLGHGPGVQLACELGAAAADHCTYLSDADVAALADSGVVAGLLPGVEFSTRHPYPGRPAPAVSGGAGSRSPPTATPARPTRPRCRSASRWPCGRWG